MKEKLIPLNSGVAVVDIEDYEFLVSYGNWSRLRGGRVNYAVSKGKFMHRLIMNPPDNMEVHHINHDGLDNRKQNLQICSHSENQKNRRSYKTIGRYDIWHCKLI